jgi:penicillin-binding protein 1B
MLGVDVPTGEIRSLVGGRNYDRSQFNRVLFAKRQVGSLFKPFVYIAAFEPSLSRQNITPATLVNDTRFVLKRKFSDDWSPRNYENHYEGVVTVRRALEHSLNAASVRLGLSVGVDAIVKAAKSLGVDTELEANPSMILGAVGVPPIEMAQAYTTMARMGERIPLHAVRYVTDEKGRTLQGAKTEPQQVFPARDAFLIVHVMEGVVDRGTAASSRALGFRKRAAGKTGTTNEKRDAWFIGFTPYTLALTWIGFDDNAPVGVSGSEGAVPIWSRYMRDITASQRDAEFAPPQGITFAQVDEMSGGLATVSCPASSVVNEAFKSGTEPGGPCPLHNVMMNQPLPFDQVPVTGTDYPTATDGSTFPTQTLSPNQAPPLQPSEIPPSLRQPDSTVQPPTTVQPQPPLPSPPPAETTPPPDQTTTDTQTR